MTPLGLIAVSLAALSAGFALLWLLPRHITAKEAAACLGKRSQALKRARKRSRTASHIEAMRADIDRQRRAAGKPAREWRVVVK